MVSATKERYYALDGLRAVMMLLGVLIHSALSYATWTFGLYSAFHDTEHTFILTGLGFLIHLFRMPAFFLVAGFFASVLWCKYGAAAMLRNRARRILIPLCVSWIVLFPITIFSAAFTMLGGPEGIATVIGQLRSGALLARNNMTPGQLLAQLGLLHLWFLYFLMIFCVAMAAITYGLRRLPQHWKDSVDRFFRFVVRQPLSVIGLSIVTFLTMIPMHPANRDTTGLEVTNAFLPPLYVLAAYFVFFGFGWLLFRHRDLLPYLSGRAWSHTMTGLCTAGLYAVSILHPLVAKQHAVQTIIASLAIWLLVLGITGLFLRYAGRPNALLRYLADSSYWVYLVHLPLTLFLPGLLIGVAIPAILKFLLVCVGATGISLLTYHYWVRTTFIGKALNGQRLPPSALFNRKKNKEAVSRAA